MISVPALERDLLIIACATSAGVHAALVRDHFYESSGVGGGFLVATVFLGGLTFAMTRSPESAVVNGGAALVLAALLVSYALATTTGMPVLHPDPEPFDGLALATKGSESVGLLLALDLLRRRAPVPPYPSNGRKSPMSRTRMLRPIPLGLTMLVALVSALVALGVSGGHDARAHENGAHAKNGAVSNAELAFRNDMRKLWEDHVTWTRLAIISLTTDAPDTEASVGRLLRNQVDIGDAIKPFYGEAAGEELTRLLRDHILIAADLIAAAKAGDQPGIGEAQTRWTANADEIAGFFASANPRSWKVDEMKEMLDEHLRLTTNEAVARLTGDWGADVAAYDQIHVQALEMADMLSTGIVKQFPKRFR